MVNAVSLVFIFLQRPALSLQNVTYYLAVVKSHGIRKKIKILCFAKL